MNLILFEPAETERPLPRADRRAQHILQVLHRTAGDTFDVGLINGSRGKATLLAVASDALTLEFTWGSFPPPPPSIALIVGLPRPQTARDILRDATTLGVTELHFVRTEKGEPSYAQSSLWHGGEWRRHLIAGAEQAFDTRIPDLTYNRTLADSLASLPPATASTRLALDNYESTAALGKSPLVPAAPVVLALGAERGWSASERDLLRAHDFALVHLGARVLRTETAVVAALAIIRAKLDRM